MVQSGFQLAGPDPLGRYKQAATFPRQKFSPAIYTEAPCPSLSAILATIDHRHSSHWSKSYLDYMADNPIAVNVPVWYPD